MRQRIEELMSKILSEQHDAKITIKFKEKNNASRNETDAVREK